MDKNKKIRVSYDTRKLTKTPDLKIDSVPEEDNQELQDIVAQELDEQFHNEAVEGRRQDDENQHEVVSVLQQLENDFILTDESDIES